MSISGRAHGDSPDPARRVSGLGVGIANSDCGFRGLVGNTGLQQGMSLKVQGSGMRASGFRVRAWGPVRSCWPSGSSICICRA